MMSLHRITVFALLALGAAACREPDGPVGPVSGARAFVNSDPVGGRILVDGESTGRITPDTLRGLVGRHDITVQLDTFDASYGYTARVFLGDTDSLTIIDGPLVMRCSDAICFANHFRHYSANRVRFASNPVGTFFHRAGNGDGVIWPSLTNNSYASAGMVGFAGIADGTDTVALGIYDTRYLAGRPQPVLAQSADRIDLTQSTWILPPSSLLRLPTVRGIEVREHTTAVTDVDDVVVVRLVFRNITNDPLYAALDPTVPPSGLTFDKVWVGFLLDPDVGEPADDMLSYEPDLNLVFAYDADFNETRLGGGFNRAPGLIGLRMFEVPAGATVVMNGWTSQGTGSQDWNAGEISEKLGYGMLSGTGVFSPDHQSPRLGHLPPSPGDIRISVSAGPFRLVPGDSVAVAIAVMLAAPVPGLFSPGIDLDPGNPLDKTRPLYATAADLFERAIAATGVTALDTASTGN
ncbi:MAG: PEGA domain-containing protein [Gemmatimonadota bacterium]|jgi:hypothetical protein